MNFKKYLIEQDFKTEEEIKEFIVSNCQPYIKERGLDKGNSPLYRSVKSSFDYLIKTPRKNRRPLDMIPIISEMLNDVLYKRIGWKPRTEGVFTSVSKSKASLFNNLVYAIYPIGPFKYVWFKGLTDSISIQEKILKKLYTKKIYIKKSMFNVDNIMIFKDKLKSGEVSGELKEEIKEEMKESLLTILNKEHIPVTNNLNILKGQEEVTLKCKKYLLLDINISKNITL